MQPSDFPILVSTIQSIPPRPATGRRAQPGEMYDGAGHVMNQLEKGIALFNEAETRGSLSTAQYKDMRDWFNRAFYEMWRQFEDNHEGAFDFYVARRDAPQKVVDVLGALAPEIHTIPGRAKKIATLPQDDPAVKAAAPLYAELLKIAAPVNAMKDKIVKRVPKTEEEKRAARYEAPKSSSKAVARVQTLLTEIVDGQYQQLFTILRDRNLAVLDDFIKAQKQAEKNPTLNEPLFGGKHSDRYTLRWHFTTPKNAPYRQRRVQAGGVALLSRAMDYHDVVKPDARQILTDEAEKDAKDIRNYFIAKNLRKIVSILEAKGDDNFATAEIVSHTVDLSGLSGTIRFAFKDGSAFTVTNSVVFVVNSFGTEFNRFPLTFHNVLLPNGVPMKSPSEQRMNTVFLGK